MNGSSESSKGPLGGAFAWPSVILVCLAIIGYFTTRPALRSLRPDADALQVPAPPAPPGVSAVHARLWEDPLAAAYNAPKDAPRPSDWLSELAKVASSQPDDLSEVRRIFREIMEVIADESKDAEGSKSVDKPENLGESKTGRLLCMPVLLPGGPYEGDKETRLRTRYAILSALALRHYKLSLPNRMSYVNLPLFIEHRSIGSITKIKAKVPVKLFKKDGVHRQMGQPIRDDLDYSAVLVCWVNESQLGGRPLMALLQILDGLFRNASIETKKRIDIRILGPTGSDSLLAMALEHANWSHWMTHLPGLQRGESLPFRAKHPQRDCVRYLDSLYAYKELACNLAFSDYGKTVLLSPRATVSEDSLVTNTSDRSLRKAFHDFVDPGREPGRSGVEVVRTIGEDRLLVTALQHELDLRGAWPQRPSSPKGRVKEHLVLVVEQDTLYGRAIAQKFREEVYDSTHAKTEASPARESETGRYLSVFSFLRGIDGRTGTEANRRVTETKGSKQSDQTPEEEPHGPAQIDYLRRLESRVVHGLEQQGLNKRDVAAVGVIGTDVYDKLLVLRALRQHFPNARFFTTDLEACFSTRSEYEFTHNLLVASHFPLELHSSLQRGVPPFRDSYQTATFYSALWAIGDPVLLREIDRHPRHVRSEHFSLASTTQHLTPLVFEIGRKNAYQLTATAKSDAANVFPRSPREHPWLLGSMQSAMWFAFIFTLIGASATLLIPWLGRWLDPLSKPFAPGMLALLAFLILLAWASGSVLCFVAILSCISLFAMVALKVDSNRDVWGTRFLLTAYFVFTLVLLYCSFSCQYVAQTIIVTSIFAFITLHLCTDLRRFLWSEGAGHAMSVLVVLAFVLAAVIWWSHRHPDHEPFSMWDGISAWPPSVIRLMAAVLGIMITLQVCRLLKSTNRRLIKRHLPEEVNGETSPEKYPIKLDVLLPFRLLLDAIATVWSWRFRLRSAGSAENDSSVQSLKDKRLLPFLGSDDSNSSDGRELLRRYCQWGETVPRLRRAFMATLTFYFAGLLFLLATGALEDWDRGWIAPIASILALQAVIVCMLYLVFLVLDAIQLCCQFMASLSVDMDFTSERAESWCQRAVQALNRGDNYPRRIAIEIYHLRIIADCSEVVSKIAFWPLPVMLILLITRLPIFDNPYLPWPKALLAAIVFLAILVGSITLRICGQRARRRILARLQTGLTRAMTEGKREKEAGCAGPPLKDLYEQAIKETKEERQGAFQPWTEDRFLHFLAIPFGGVGGLVLLDELLQWF